MDESSRLRPNVLEHHLPQYIHCHACCVLTLRERDKQLKDGVPLEKVSIIPPNIAYTFEPQMSAGMVVSVPVCLMHMAYKEESLLRG